MSLKNEVNNINCVLFIMLEFTKKLSFKLSEISKYLYAHTYI